MPFLGERKALKEQAIMPDSNISSPLRMFPNIPMIGELPNTEIEKKLEELGVIPPAAKAGLVKAGWWAGTGAWKYTTHQFGYIPPSSKPGSKEIKSVGDIPADEKLKEKRIDIHLNRLRVYEYPGSGQHRICLRSRLRTSLRRCLNRSASASSSGHAITRQWR